MNFSPDRQIGQENGPGDGATMRKFMSEASESYLTEKFYLGSAFRNLNEIEPPIHDVYEAYKLRISTPNASNAEIIKKKPREFMKACVAVPIDTMKGGMSKMKRRSAKTLARFSTL